MPKRLMSKPSLRKSLKCNSSHNAEKTCSYEQVFFILTENPCRGGVSPPAGRETRPLHDASQTQQHLPTANISSISPEWISSALRISHSQSEYFIAPQVHYFFLLFHSQAASRPMANPANTVGQMLPVTKTAVGPSAPPMIPILALFIRFSPIQAHSAVYPMRRRHHNSSFFIFHVPKVRFILHYTPWMSSLLQSICLPSLARNSLAVLKCPQPKKPL